MLSPLIDFLTTYLEPDKMPDCDNNIKSLAEELAKFDVSEDNRLLPTKSAEAFVVNVVDEDKQPTQVLGETATATETTTTNTTTTNTTNSTTTTTTTTTTIVTPTKTTVMDEQMLKKKETIMLMSLKRRAELLEAKRAIKSNELDKQREKAAIKQKQQEIRKQKREAIFEQYKQRKKAAEAAEKSSHGGSATNLSTQPKAGPRSIKSAHHVSAWTLYTGPKLFAKPTVKTNLTIIQNAILKALEGAANAKTLQKMQETISAHSETCGHFLILFRNRHQFKGLYEYNQKENSITKLDGLGPKVISSESIAKYYKYDSPKRLFVEVQTKHISLTIIGFSIQSVF